MALRVDVAPDVLVWAAAQSGRDAEDIDPHWDEWISGTREPTLHQLEAVARKTGVPFGYLLLPEPPRLTLPVPDFREGYSAATSDPSADLLAVVHQSIRRQDWYREYAAENSLSPVDVVGSAAQSTPVEAAADMRHRLGFEVDHRSGTRADIRKDLLSGFEDLGGLTVATSMVGNNTHRLLDPEEFRGFALVDRYAPLVFVNTNQTLNGQIFTIAHEMAHVWHGSSGIGSADPRRIPHGSVERWCDDTASEFLVPADDLAKQYGLVTDLPWTERLDTLARRYRCGTLVVLQAIRRAGLRTFADFDAVYETELQRLLSLQPRGATGGGSYFHNQPYRIGRRLSLALIRDALEGRTTLTEALSLTGLSTLKNFDRYAAHLEAL